MAVIDEIRDIFNGKSVALAGPAPTLVGAGLGF